MKLVMRGNGKPAAEMMREIAVHQGRSVTRARTNQVVDF